MKSIQTLNKKSIWLNFISFNIGDFQVFTDKFHALVSSYQRLLPGLNVDIEAELAKYKNYAEEVRPFVIETVSYLNSAIKANKSVLVEGANAAMLDIDFGKAIRL